MVHRRFPEVVAENLGRIISGWQEEDGEISRRGCNGLPEVGTQIALTEHRVFNQWAKACLVSFSGNTNQSLLFSFHTKFEI